MSLCELTEMCIPQRISSRSVSCRHLPFHGEETPSYVADWPKVVQKRHGVVVYSPRAPQRSGTEAALSCTELLVGMAKAGL